MSITPPSRPQLPAAKAREILAAHDVQSPVALVGIRGYYRNSMGKPNQNDRGIFDDCIALVTPDRVVTFNANTDPSTFRKGIATLKPGVHMYRKGLHGINRPGGGYPALRPATEGERLPVIRDPGVSDYGVAINIHRGSRNSTSSEGCQTIQPDQWGEFIAAVYAAMDRHGVKKVPYCLVVNDGSIA